MVLRNSKLVVGRLILKRRLLDEIEGVTGVVKSGRW